MPFLVSIVVTIGAYFIGKTIREPKILKEAMAAESGSAAPKKKIPFIEVFRTHPAAVARVALGILFAVTNTVVTVYALSFATTGLGISATLMLWVMIAANVVGLLMQATWGWVSDKLGRKKVFIAGSLGCAVLIFVYFEALETMNGWAILGASLALTSVFYAMPNGVYPAMFPEQFDAEVRYTGVALGLQIGLLIASFTPTISAALVNGNNQNWPLVAIFVAVACVIAAVATAFNKETAFTPIEELGAGK